MEYESTVEIRDAISALAEDLVTGQKHVEELLGQLALNTERIAAALEVMATQQHAAFSAEHGADYCDRLP